MQVVQLLLEDFGVCLGARILAFVGAALRRIFLGVVQAVLDGLGRALGRLRVLVGEELLKFVYGLVFFRFVARGH